MDRFQWLLHVRHLPSQIQCAIPYTIGDQGHTQAVIALNDVPDSALLFSGPADHHWN